MPVDPVERADHRPHLPRGHWNLSHRPSPLGQEGLWVKFYSFYVYKYTTSHCAAENIAKRILEGEPGAVDAYLSFLKGGSSEYPIDLLKMARVDMTSPEPIQDAMRLFEKMLDQTEELLVAMEQ